MSLGGGVEVHPGIAIVVDRGGVRTDQASGEFGTITKAPWGREVIE